MKPKIYFKLTFSKAILFTALACAFYVTRNGSDLKHTVNKHKTTPAVTAPPPKVEVPGVVETVKSAPAIVEVPAPVIVVRKPHKRFTVQKRSQKTQQAIIKEAALENLMNDQLAVFDISTDALDIQAPLDELISAGFEEKSSEKEIFFASIRTEKIHGESLPEMETVFHQFEGEIKKNDFEDIKNALADIKEQGTQATKMGEQKPQEVEKNVLAGRIDNNRPLVSNASADSHKAVKLVAETESTQSIPLEQDPDSGAKEQDEGDNDEPTLAIPESKKVDLSPLKASLVPELTGSQFASSNKRVVTKKTQTTRNQMNTQQASDPESNSSNGEKLFGTIYVDDELDQWLVSNKGHIELSLHKVSSPNPEDTIKLYEYLYPDRDFSHDTSKLEGKHVLTANIYAEKDKTPFLQINYPKALSPENFGEKIVFNLKMQKGKPTDREIPVLNLTVFEAASGNYRQAKSVVNAEIRIVGLESFGSFKTDKDGNARIENIPLHSELMVDVSAEGYYPTRKIVAITGTSAYATISLIEKQKVETVTSFFTRKPQDARKSVFFGRLFDAESRKPLSDDEVYLSNRKGHALYFSALPDTSLTRSTSTGLFAFMNVEPAFRTISRNKSPHVFPIQPLAGYGYYTDLGRGGKKSIRAVVTDPILNQVVFGSAKTIGSADYQAESEASGKFEIQDVDLPSGNITIEFRAKDYPVTWYTLPWETRDSTRTQKLYILEKELIYESAVSYARVRPEKHKGILIGGADAEFFKNNNGCVSVDLLDNNGIRLTEEKGPYLLYQRTHAGENPCLTKDKSGFAFYNLDAGEYIINWKSKAGKILSSQVVRVGSDRLSIVVR